jgi:hypothetical protein
MRSSLQTNDALTAYFDLMFVRQASAQKRSRPYCRSVTELTRVLINDFIDPLIDNLFCGP